MITCHPTNILLSNINEYAPKHLLWGRHVRLSQFSNTEDVHLANPHAPVLGSHFWTTHSQGFLFGQVFGVPLHSPLMHVSFTVHLLPSLQGWPFAYTAATVQLPAQKEVCQISAHTLGGVSAQNVGLSRRRWTDGGSERASRPGVAQAAAGVKPAATYGGSWRRTAGTVQACCIRGGLGRHCACRQQGETSGHIWRQRHIQLRQLQSVRADLACLRFAVHELGISLAVLFCGWDLLVLCCAVLCSAWVCTSLC
jgi:hypothetical protein